MLILSTFYSVALCVEDGIKNWTGTRSWHKMAIYAHFRYRMGFLRAKIGFLVQKYTRIVGIDFLNWNSDQFLGQFFKVSVRKTCGHKNVSLSGAERPTFGSAQKTYRIAAKNLRHRGNKRPIRYIFVSECYRSVPVETEYNRMYLCL